MASKFETSFGARLRKFEDAIQYIQNWPVYTPSRPEIAIAELQALVQSIKNANNKETDIQLHYQEAVAVRTALFSKGAQSLEKLMSSIRFNVNFLYGRQSPQAESIGSIIRRFRSSRLIKLPADPANPDAEKTISQSQRSYGSRTQFFADIVTTLKSSPNYSSDNAALTLAALEQKLADLTTASNNVASQLQKIASIRKERLIQYEQMAKAARLIKDYAAAQYGNRSTEYRSVMALGL